MESKASEVTGPDGLAAVQIIGSIIKSLFFPSLIKPEIGIFLSIIPSVISSPIFRPGQPSPFIKLSKFALSGANVFVSC